MNKTHKEIIDNAKTKAYEEIINGDGIYKFLNFYVYNENLSLENKFIVFGQDETAKNLYNYNQWNTVTKIKYGAKAIKVLPQMEFLDSVNLFSENSVVNPELMEQQRKILNQEDFRDLENFFEKQFSGLKESDSNKYKCLKYIILKSYSDDDIKLDNINLKFNDNDEIEEYFSDLELSIGYFKYDFEYYWDIETADIKGEELNGENRSNEITEMGEDEVHLYVGESDGRIDEVNEQANMYDLSNGNRSSNDQLFQRNDASSELGDSKPTLHGEVANNAGKKSDSSRRNNKTDRELENYLKENKQNIKPIIYSYYINAPKKERIKVLIREYDKVRDDIKNQNTNSFYMGMSIDNQHYNWNAIDKKILDLIKNDEYLNDVELLHYQNNKNDDEYYREAIDEQISLFDSDFEIFYEEKESEINKPLNEVIDQIDIEVEEIDEVDEVDATIKEYEKSGKMISEFFPYHEDFKDENLVNVDNFKIKDKIINTETESVRFENNIEAIKLLKLLEKENSYANEVEKQILNKYVGWGGLSTYFDENKNPDKNNLLKNLLSNEEYNKAKESTLTSFYTQPFIINAMYKAVKSFGFESGNILEPALGTGNFFGAINDESIEKSNLYGVEIDEISGRIAKKLYPKANIEITGFENSKYKDNSFDLVIGNVPFGNYSVNDSKYNKYNFKIHDYFFAKSIDQVRNGGIIALITSKGTMDKLSSKTRNYISERCDLIGAIRLPNSVFKGSANTDVVSDIIFLSKRDKPQVEMPNWTKSKAEYFFSNDVMLNGKEVINYNQFRDVMIDRINNEPELVQSEFIKNRHNPPYDWPLFSRMNHFFDDGNEFNLYDIMVNDFDLNSEDHDDLNYFLKEKALHKCGLGYSQILSIVGEEDRSVYSGIVKTAIDDREDIIKYLYNVLEKETININNYFIDNPDMVLGEIDVKSNQFGHDIYVKENNVEVQLENAISNLKYEYINGFHEDLELKDNTYITADINLPNFQYSIVDDKVYYRENGIMYEPYNINENQKDNLKSLVEIKEKVKFLIKIQIDGCSDEVFEKEKKELNELYDDYVNKYSYINNQGKLMQDDTSIALLKSLEKFDENKNFIGKADLFVQRTISPNIEVEKAETAYEALALSMGYKGKIDLEYMSELTNKDRDIILNELDNIMYYDPNLEKYVTSDEYLSGNIREKLKIVESLNDDKYTKNINALKEAMPNPLNASEIEVRLGSTWVSSIYVKEFLKEKFQLNYWSNVDVKYSDYTTRWNITNKSGSNNNINLTATYGTDRINALELTELALNLKTPRIEDNHPTKVDNKGKPIKVVNEYETQIACNKQDLIKEEFKNWIFSNIDRREKLEKIYNEKFNSIRPREYNGDWINPIGINNTIRLRSHQKDAIARIIYGGNTLLAHSVGAGKTFAMVIAGMESKRLGLCNKPLYVVPNHLVGQWGKEFLTVYPNANILCATKNDLVATERRKFCSKIATGNFDAVILTHSQFEKIPLSYERRKATIEAQIEELNSAINEVGIHKKNYTVKQMEVTKKKMERKLEILLNEDRKDDVVTFEELGVDMLFVDEAHLYKNRLITTKMNNVAGLGASTSAQKSSDMYAKTEYLNEITDGKGIVFATGTPISNSMSEMYVMQTYLQSNLLKKLNLNSFDNWATTFGEAVTAMEIKPEGSGYRTKTRFAKFFNISELVNIFKETADIKTSDMLNLPVPNVKRVTTKIEASEFQKNKIKEYANRADFIRNGSVDTTIDNMLKITMEGRALALDERLVMDEITKSDNQNNKINSLVENALDHYKNSNDIKGTQLIFCDLSTPGKEWNVYQEVKDKLIENGIDKNEIAFIHEVDKEEKRLELYKKVNEGKVRFLLGSTAKLGAGTNVQNKLVALHHLDVPWRPSDVEQREGRIIRQGNTNKEVTIHTYVTQDTFDIYSWQTIENKQRFISQIMTSKSSMRIADDIDETVLECAQIKAIATGNPLIVEKMTLETDIAKLRLNKSSFLNVKYKLENKILNVYPKELADAKAQLENAIKDKVVFDNLKNKELILEVNNNKISDKVEINKYLNSEIQKIHLDPINYKSDMKLNGLTLNIIREVAFNLNDNITKFDYSIEIASSKSYKIDMGSDNYTRIKNFINKDYNLDQLYKSKIDEIENSIKNSKEIIEKPFDKEEELNSKIFRLDELNKYFSNENSKDEIIEDNSICKSFKDTLKQAEEKANEYNKKLNENNLKTNALVK